MTTLMRNTQGKNSHHFRMKFPAGFVLKKRIYLPRRDPFSEIAVAGEALDGRITNVWSSKLIFFFMHILSTDCIFLAIYRLLTN